MAANSVYQYEQPRCPDGWNESERRFYTRLIEVLDDIYSKYGRIDEKMLSNKVVDRIDSAPEVALNQAAANVESSGKLAVDSIESTFAYLVALSSRYGNFEFADIENLVASAMVLRQGTAGELFVENLRVTFAQMASATISDLCIQASDGNYYKLDVSDSGTVTATQVEVSETEKENGRTEDGSVILATNITTEELNAQNIMATYALINKIDAARIDVDELFANEAFIEALTAKEFFADGGTLKIIAKVAENVGKWFIFGENGLTVQKEGSRWSTLTDENGYHIIEQGQTDPAGSFQSGGLRTTGVSMGDIICKRTATGGWVWTDAAQGGE